MATVKQWAETEGKLPNNVPALRWSMSCCILELRARVEALEAAQPKQTTQEELAKLLAQPARVVPLATASAGSLVERVAYAINGDSDGPINWKPEARAAIREVAAWMRETHGWSDGSLMMLEQEAER